MNFKCPCCGSETSERPTVEALSYVGMRPIARRALEALIAMYPRTVSATVLSDLVWANDPNGGPGDPDNVLSVSICYANKILRESGWRIGAPKRGMRGQIGLRQLQ